VPQGGHRGQRRRKRVKEKEGTKEEGWDWRRKR